MTKSTYLSNINQGKWVPWGGWGGGSITFYTGRLCLEAQCQNNTISFDCHILPTLSVLLAQLPKGFNLVCLALLFLPKIGHPFIHLALDAISLTCRGFCDAHIVKWQKIIFPTLQAKKRHPFRK